MKIILTDLEKPLAEAGERVVPCLIDKISDTTKTDFENCTATSGNTRVGDVAFTF